MNEPTETAAPFGSPDCTCIPYTGKYGTPRYCGPNETVDDISGWEQGTDCPHHAPAVPLPPADQPAPRDRIAAALYAHDHPHRVVQLDETGMGPAYRESADAVLAVLPATTNHDTDTSAALASVSPHTLAFIANHLDARAVAYIQAGSRTFAEWQKVAAELRRVADETAAAATQAATWGVCQDCGAAAGPDCDCPPFAEQQTVPVQHAPGKAILCPDCRDKGYTVCLDGPADAAPQRPSAARYLDAFLHRGPGYDLTPEQPAAGARQDGAQP